MATIDHRVAENPTSESTECFDVDVSGENYPVSDGWYLGRRKMLDPSEVVVVIVFYMDIVFLCGAIKPITGEPCADFPAAVNVQCLCGSSGCLF